MSTSFETSACQLQRARSRLYQDGSQWPQAHFHALLELYTAICISLHKSADIRTFFRNISFLDVELVLSPAHVRKFRRHSARFIASSTCRRTCDRFFRNFTGIRAWKDPSNFTMFLLKFCRNFADNYSATIDCRLPKLRQKARRELRQQFVSATFSLVKSGLMPS